jgi:tyrosine-protein kinase
LAEQETSLWDLLDIVRRRWRLVVVVAVSLALGATLYAERQPLQYDASAIVAVTPREGQPSAELVRVAAPRYASYITAPATIRKMAAQLDEDPAELQQRVKATIIPDTGNITVTVRHPDPQRAVRAANALSAQLRRASAGNRLVLVEPVAPAVLPQRPAAPPRRLIEAAALVVGLLLGVGLAVLLDAARDRPARSRADGRPLPVGERGQGGLATVAPRRAPGRVQAPPPAEAELPVLGGYPVVGDLPWSRALGTSIGGALASSPLAGAVEELYARLARELGGSPHGTIVVTSPRPHQGKTTVARLLAATVLRSGARVLLVDGHKEHPEILRNRKDRENGGGAPSANKQHLESGLNWVKDLWAMDDGLWVLPAARGPVAVALTEGREREILEEAGELFETIIVDGPPMLDDGHEAQASISQTLIPLADAVLFVVSPDSTVESLYRSLEALHTVPTPFVGVVLNRVREASGVAGASNVRRLLSRPRREDAGER